MFKWGYKYRYWDADLGENAISQDACKLEAIRAGLGVPIIETGIKVRHENVDDSGRFHAYVPPPGTSIPKAEKET